jgi:CheY-like chemotaxis protein
MAKILQVAYSRILLSTRAAMMESQGDSVISVTGNDEAMALKDAQLQGVDLIVIGSAATHAKRTEIVRHFKKHFPKTPVLALLGNNFQARIAEADFNTSIENPEEWLRAVRTALKDGRNE